MCLISQFNWNLVELLFNINMKTRRVSSKDTIDLESDNENEYNTLCHHKWEYCEFCDKRFSDRYSMLKHNVSHIIIPLIKMTTHQCEECLHHFTSIEDLQLHITKKHTDTRVIARNPVRIKFEEDFADKIPDILQSIVEKQVIVKCEDELKDVFIKCNELRKINELKDCDSTILNTKNIVDKNVLVKCKDEGNVFVKCNELKNNNRHKQHDSSILNSNGILNSEGLLNNLKEEPFSPEASPRLGAPSNEDKETICQRLLFEEEMDIEDTLFQDLSADCHVSLESLEMDLFSQPLNMPSDPGLPSSPLTVIPKVELTQSSNLDGIANSSYMGNDKSQENTYAIKYKEAVHYDVLMESDGSTCKICKKEFPNRFKLLQHEAKHLRVKQRKWRVPLCCVCERYISGNYVTLKIHMERKHPEELERKIRYTVYDCPQCGLKYHSYPKHLQNYHVDNKCLKFGESFESNKLRNLLEFGDIKSNKNSKHNPTQLCQNKGFSCRISYEDTNVKSLNLDAVEKSTAVMQLCEMCFSFMKIYMQNRHNYDELGEKTEFGVQQTCDKCNNKFFSVKLVRRKQLVSNNFQRKVRPLTNIERLKKMQNRLKMMKMINKY